MAIQAPSAVRGGTWEDVFPPAITRFVLLHPAGAPNPYFDPCLSYRAALYLSDAEVQQALHAIGVGARPSPVG